MFMFTLQRFKGEKNGQIRLYIIFVEMGVPVLLRLLKPQRVLVVIRLAHCLLDKARNIALKIIIIF